MGARDAPLVFSVFLNKRDPSTSANNADNTSSLPEDTVTIPSQRRPLLKSAAIATFLI